MVVVVEGFEVEVEEVVVVVDVVGALTTAPLNPYSDRRSGPPQIELESPLQVILQLVSPSGAGAPLFAREFPQ